MVLWLPLKWFMRVKRGGSDGYIMKVEAFDSVIQKYFEKTMPCMGFGTKKQRCLIHECISSSYLSISINGSPSHEFGVEHGLHQDVHPLYLI